MIAVVGRIDDAATLGIARRAVRCGATAQVVATVPPGTDGDRRLAELASAGVGHAAALRSPAPALEPADVDLALRYLPDLRVVVLAADGSSIGASVAEAAAWAGARLIQLTGEGSAGGAPDDAIMLAAPRSDPDEAFAGMVALLAARLDGGESPSAAWAAVERDLGLEGRPINRGAVSPSDPGPPRRR